MPMTMTKGSRWLVDNGGRSWCRLVRRSEEIDLNEKGGYAFKGQFIHLDTPIMMDEGFFLVVASEYPDRGAANGDEMSYHFALIQGVANNVRAVSDEELYRTVFDILDRGSNLVPEDRHGKALNNWQYMAAIYCKAYYRAVALKKPSLPPGITVPSQTRKNDEPGRRIIRGLLKPIEPVEQVVETPVEEPDPFAEFLIEPENQAPVEEPEHDIQLRPVRDRTGRRPRPRPPGEING